MKETAYAAAPAPSLGGMIRMGREEVHPNDDQRIRRNGHVHPHEALTGRATPGAPGPGGSPGGFRP